MGLGSFAVAMVLAGCGGSDAAPNDPGCPSDQKLCNGSCVSLTNWVYGCASESCEPCNLPNAKQACSAAGECIMEGCSRSSAFDCDGVAATGCEVESSNQNCGGCGIACPTSAPHTTDAPFCAQGTSGAYSCILRCEAGYGDADGNLSNGCEKPELFSSAPDCPTNLPAPDSDCEQDHWGSTCTYAHPDIGCTQIMDCVVPLSTTQTPYWILLGNACP